VKRNLVCTLATKELWWKRELFAGAMELIDVSGILADLAYTSHFPPHSTKPRPFLRMFFSQAITDTTQTDKQIEIGKLISSSCLPGCSTETSETSETS